MFAVVFLDAAMSPRKIRSSFAPKAFLAQTGWERITLRHPKNKLIIARREPAMRF